MDAPRTRPGRFFLASALLAATAMAAADQTTATIEGVVVDAEGTSLPGVTVTVTGPGVRQERITQGDGAYASTGLAAGGYVVTASLLGFETAESPVSLTTGATQNVRLVLHLVRLLETVTVVAEEPRSFARNIVSQPMLRQQSKITNVTSVVDNLPGVSVQEGDSYGFDDWSANVAMRGFQVTINDVQIGTTIDGFPNGTSDYWSGAAVLGRTAGAERDRLRHRLRPDLLPRTADARPAPTTSFRAAAPTSTRAVSRRTASNSRRRCRCPTSSPCTPPTR